MKVFFFVLFLILSSSLVWAELESHFGIDIDIAKLIYKKPVDRHGPAGNLSFRNAKMYSDTITTNIHNGLGNVDAELFIRPNFLGFMTQFGEFGYKVDENSQLKQITLGELSNARVIMDDYRLNFSGEDMSVRTDLIRLKMQKYRIDCKDESKLHFNEDSLNLNTNEPFNIAKNCLNDAVIDGSYIKSNKMADVEFEHFVMKTKMNAKLKTLELKPQTIRLDLGEANLSSKNLFFIHTDALLLECDKEKNIAEFDFDRIYKVCTNHMRIDAKKIAMNDKVEGTQFDLDLHNFEVVNRIVFIGLNAATLTKASSQIMLNQVNVKCKKSSETDLLELRQVLADCIDEGELAIQALASSTPAENDQNADAKNIFIMSDHGKINIQADVHFLGMDHHVSISALASVVKNENKVKLMVTETQLPFGIKSTNLLMLFLKKYFVSKDIQVLEKNIFIAL